MDARRYSLYAGWIALSTLAVSGLLSAVIILDPDFAPCPMFFYVPPSPTELFACQLSKTIPGIVVLYLWGLSLCAIAVWRYASLKRKEPTHGT